MPERLAPDELDAERVVMEAAVAAALADPRPAVSHAVMRTMLLKDAARARARIEELARLRPREG